MLKTKKDCLHEMKYIASLFREVKDCQTYCRMGSHLRETHNEIQVLVHNLFDDMIKQMPD